MQESGTEVQRIENEIFGHPIIRGENPYIGWFASEPKGPTDAEMKDLVIQLGTFSQELALIRIGRKMYAPYPYPQKQCGGCGSCATHTGVEERVDEPHGDDSREDESAYAAWLNAVAALLLDTKKDLKGNVFGSAALASRETVHAIHQLERAYGSGNGHISDGARFAIGVWVGVGTGKGMPLGKNFFRELLKGVGRYNTRRRDAGLTFLPPARHAAPFLSEREFAASVLQTVDCPHKRRDMHSTHDWFFGAKIALDAVELFWFGLNKRRHTLK